MIRVEKSHNKEEWDEYVLENGGHPLQLWGWGQVKAGHGWKAERLFILNEDDEKLAATQVLIRRLPFPFKSFAYIPRGPVGEEKYYQEALDAVAEFVQQEYKSVALSVESASREINLTEVWQKSPNKILSRETIILQLGLNENELLTNMAKKTRQYIHKSAADGVEVRRAKSRDDLEVCLQMYEETAKRAGFNLHDRQYYLDVFQQMGEHSPIFMAFVEDRPVAFLWLAVSAEMAYELYGGMNDEGQLMRANYALKWHVIRKMKEWGVSEYDFGGMVAGGVSTFKHGWSEESTLLSGTFDRPLSPLYGVWTNALPKVKKLLQTIKRR